MWWNGGAYADIGPRVTQKSGFTAGGPYDIANLDIDSYQVYTHLPPAGSGPLCVEIDASPDAARGTRFIGGGAMPTRLWRDGDVLCERLGVATFGFHLEVVNEAIVWRVVRVGVFGVSLPPRWFTGVGAREFAEDARYRFEVWASLPRAGLLVRYRGWLDAG